MSTSSAPQEIESKSGNKIENAVDAVGAERQLEVEIIFLQICKACKWIVQFCWTCFALTQSCVLGALCIVIKLLLSKIIRMTKLDKLSSKWASRLEFLQDKLIPSINVWWYHSVVGLKVYFYPHSIEERELLGSAAFETTVAGTGNSKNEEMIVMTNRLCVADDLVAELVAYHCNRKHGLLKWFVGFSQTVQQFFAQKFELIKCSGFVDIFSDYKFVRIAEKFRTWILVRPESAESAAIFDRPSEYKYVRPPHTGHLWKIYSGFTQSAQNGQNSAGAVAPLLDITIAFAGNGWQTAIPRKPRSEAGLSYLYPLTLSGYGPSEVHVHLRKRDLSLNQNQNLSLSLKSVTDETVKVDDAANAANAANVAVDRDEYRKRLQRVWAEKDELLAEFRKRQRFPMHQVESSNLAVVAEYKENGNWQYVLLVLAILITDFSILQLGQFFSGWMFLPAFFNFLSSANLLLSTNLIFHVTINYFRDQRIIA